MRFEPSKCPKCGQPWAGTVDTIPGNVAGLSYDAANDDFEWSGSTEVNYDGQTTNATPAGLAVVWCDNCGAEREAIWKDHERGGGDFTPTEVDVTKRLDMAYFFPVAADRVRGIAERVGDEGARDLESWDFPGEPPKVALAERLHAAADALEALNALCDFKLPKPPA